MQRETLNLGIPNNSLSCVCGRKIDENKIHAECSECHSESGTSIPHLKCSSCQKNKRWFELDIKENSCESCSLNFFGKFEPPPLSKNKSGLAHSEDYSFEPSESLIEEINQKAFEFTPDAEESEIYVSYRYRQDGAGYEVIAVYCVWEKADHYVAHFLLRKFMTNSNTISEIAHYYDKQFSYVEEGGEFNLYCPDGSDDIWKLTEASK